MDTEKLNTVANQVLAAYAALHPEEIREADNYVPRPRLEWRPPADGKQRITIVLAIYSDWFGHCEDIYLGDVPFSAFRA
jgi:hypothetical protein